MFLWLSVIGLIQNLKLGGKYYANTRNLDEGKLAEAALAILSLSRMVEPYGVTAWKGMDWDVMNILHDKGWISNPVGKQKSVGITEEGVELADQFLEKHFAK